MARALARAGTALGRGAAALGRGAAADIVRDVLMPNLLTLGAAAALAGALASALAWLVKAGRTAILP
jgi:hypothetical protein